MGRIRPEQSYVGVDKSDNQGQITSTESQIAMYEQQPQTEFVKKRLKSLRKTLTRLKR